jgi:hypothetical protein
MASAARKPAPVVIEPVIPPNLVDTYGDLAKAREQFAPTEREYQKALSGLKSLVAEADPDSEFVVRGERYTLRISKCGWEATPNVKRAMKLLGMKAFMKCVTVTKTALEKWLRKPQIEEVCDVTQTGRRTFDAIPVGAALVDRALDRAPAARAGDAPRLKKERA